ncbi:hypothetical protein FJW06_10370 [Mesorhizobium sp. B4-1-3]|uniref:hypothetical protein n=1 Tax=Mesorhizobium sp. B4-1-3 TaxID=2589889 RepID=UPI00112E64D1|nr:hypothetical protein [Mesorhizobium sp. B4-1-3]TPI14372.1 hypothetical protein FJW06_10370 [Mesorhizobium sp. B4-1-3]
MARYLVLHDLRSDQYGAYDTLIYCGVTGFFTLKIGSKQRTHRFFHLEHKVGDVSQSNDTIISNYIAKKAIRNASAEQFKVSELLTTPGYTIGRIVRPANGFGAVYAYKTDEKSTNEYLDLYAQINAFMNRLSEISRVVHPTKENFSAHGYEIRSLLILACTEVELLFKRILFERPSRNNQNMANFFKLTKLAKLDEYSVTFNFFREFGNIEPFSDWSGIPHYQPLWWYQSYNKTKHDRHSEFTAASLKSLIYSIAACAILLKAHSPLSVFGSKRHPLVENFETNFTLKSPNWAKNEQYWMIPGRPLKMIPVSEAKII